MKKAFIISCFDEYYSRNKYVELYLEHKGYRVCSFISDFQHQKKNFLYEPPRVNTTLIHTPRYGSNFSLQRIINHYVYSQKIANIIITEKPDLVYANIPPNLVSWKLGRLKKKGKIHNLIFDIYDLWPESMTFGKSSFLLRPIFTLWRWIRNKYINYADANITACKLHEEILREQSVLNLHTVYLLKERNLSTDNIQTDYNYTEIRLCYIGTVNNIIDIETICVLIQEIKKHRNVRLLFIGTGETKGAFLKRINDVGCEVTDYGVVYDEIEKEKVMLSCHFGLNIMKPQVCVGVTLKSLEYFSCGLPILNTIAGDTQKLVDEYGCGLNINNNLFSIGEIIDKLGSNDLYKMKINTLRMFEVNFSVSHFETVFDSLMEGIMNKAENVNV